MKSDWLSLSQEKGQKIRESATEWVSGVHVSLPPQKDLSPGFTYLNTERKEIKKQQKRMWGRS